MRLEWTPHWQDPTIAIAAPEERRAHMTAPIGFVGLGAMGAPMAGRLLAAGRSMVVHNRSEAAVRRLEDQGAIRADTPAAVAQHAPVVFTMLPTEQAVVDVVLGDEGIHAGARAGHVVVDLSTVSPQTVHAIAASLAGAGVAVVDAPVSGGQQGAVDGSLSIMVGGDNDDVERVRPLLEVLGTLVLHVGKSGSGQTVKAANQVLVAAIIQGLSEAITLLDASGADTATALQAIRGGLAGNRLLDLNAAALLARDFTPGGRAHLHRKDLGIALAIGRERTVYMPVTAAIDQLFTALEAQGLADLDHSALLKLAETMSGRA